MSKKIDKIVIVGGGSAGWMSASTIKAIVPDKEIIVIESENVPIIGVGESTVGGIRNWLYILGIKDQDFMNFTDATYKLAIKFNNFYEKDKGTWYYPFGEPYHSENLHHTNDWFIKKILFPTSPEEDYVDYFYPQMALVKQNKLSTLPGEPFDFYYDTAFHFDATKFGAWLRENYCKPRGVKHIESEVIEIETDETGIKSLRLANGEIISADLYVDCTGFRSLLLEQTFKVPFISYEQVLPNNRAWATRIPYTNKEKQLTTVTDCTAHANGWIWNIPLWSRIGTGYVYCDRFISPEKALDDFKLYLINNDFDISNAEFRDIQIKTGIHEKIWHKNTVALGLSAGFIEPLESTGLVTVYEFAINLCRALSRGERVSQWDQDEFNLVCKDVFNYYTQFVSMHYALSHRNDSDYWKAVGEKSYIEFFKNVNDLHTGGLYQQTIHSKCYNWRMLEDRGMHCLSAGMNWMPIDKVVLKKINSPNTDVYRDMEETLLRMNTRKQKWREAAKNCPSAYEFYRTIIYKN